MLQQIAYYKPKDRDYIPVFLIDNYGFTDEFDDIVYCSECKEPMTPVWENNGYNEPDPVHYEVVGYEFCWCEL